MVEKDWIGGGGRCFGVAAFAFGAIALVWGEFATLWQPVPSLFPGRIVLVYGTALLFLASGAGLQFRRTATIAAASAALLYSLFGAFWIARVAASPGIYGRWLGLAEQLALVLAALLLLSQTLGDRWRARDRVGRFLVQVLGICVVAFGVAHFVYTAETAALVPKALIPGPVFWALLTGLFDVAAGLALVTGIMARPAAGWLALMYGTFGLVVWLPTLFRAPFDQMSWAGNAMNLALVGAAWAAADYLASPAVVSRGRC